MRCLILLLVLAYCHGGTAIGQTKRQRQQGQANQQVAVSPTPTPSVQPTVEVREAQIARNEADRAHNITIVDERSPWPSRIANIISALLLAFVAYQAYTSNQTLKAMETYEGVLQSQCAAMSDLATAAKGELEETRKMVAQNERAVKAAEDDAKTARDAFYVGSAPYFGITAMEFVEGPLRVGHRPTLQIAFLNGGRTPAWLFYAEVTVTFGDSPDSNIEGCSWILFPERDDTANSFIPHNESRTIKFWNQFFKYTEEMQRRVNQDSKCLFVNVVLTYRDFRKRDHKRTHDFVLRKGGYFSDYRMAKDEQPEKEATREEGPN